MAAAALFLPGGKPRIAPLAHLFKKYYTQTGEVDDLISIGTIGLIKAVNTYRADKKIKLATYAARCIENAILTLKRKLGPRPAVGRVPTTSSGLLREGWFVLQIP